MRPILNQLEARYFRSPRFSYFNLNLFTEGLFCWSMYNSLVKEVSMHNTFFRETLGNKSKGFLTFFENYSHIFKYLLQMGRQDRINICRVSILKSFQVALKQQPCRRYSMTFIQCFGGLKSNNSEILVY